MAFGWQRSAGATGNPDRRTFLARSLRAAAALLTGGFLRLPAAPAYHVQPHYKEKAPLDALLPKLDAALDDFPAERYHDPIASVLADWSRELTSRSVTARRVGPETLLAGSGIEKLTRAAFQITRIAVESASRVRTQIRYELAGTGKGAMREQRSGDWMVEWAPTAGGGWEPVEAKVGKQAHSASNGPVFVDVTSRAFVGVPSYSDQLQHGVDYWRTVLDGASGIDIYGHNGISAADIDGDGFDDLYVCQPAGLPNRLYRNRGDGTFDDVTESSGVGLLDNTACALFADYRNIGRQDLIVVRASGPLLFENDGTGKFHQKPGAFTFADAPQGTFTGAAVADYDRDGWLDIYFCLYVFYQGAGQYKYPTPYYDANNGPPNFLFRNNRDGSFRDVTAAAGLNRNNTRFSFCCGWGDCSGDGWPDLYVVNDFGRKNLYRNNGDGTFTDVAAQMGVEDVGAGMGVAWFDYNNDAREDLYVADMWTAAGERIAAQPSFQKDAPPAIRDLYAKHAMGNSLFRNGPKFQDETTAAGVGMGRWAWSSDAWDFNHDGHLDLYVINGMVSGPIREDVNSFFWRQVVAKSPAEARTAADYEQGWNAVNELIRAGYSWSGFERNVLYANNGDGTFSDVSAVSGVDWIEDGRAFALADFDHDGRLDVFLKNRNAPQLRVLTNVMAELPASISFRLRGTKSNRDAIGAVVMLETAGGRQMRTLQAGSGFLSQHSKEIFFGLGNAPGTVHAEIRWPGGLTQKLRNLPPGCRIRVEEGVESFQSEPFRAHVGSAANSEKELADAVPEKVETWLLAPVAAPDISIPGGGRTLADLRGTSVLLTFSDQPAGFRENAPLARVNIAAATSNTGADEAIAVYNILFRWLFDWRRDLPLPTSFLIDPGGQIVKIYQGPVIPARVESDRRQMANSAPSDRLARALPFRGVAATYEYGRNYLSAGSMFFQRGYYPQAGAAFALASRDDPSSAEASYGLGSVALKEQKIPEARAFFEDAVKRKASYPDTKANAWNNLGLLAGNSRESNIDAAIACFREALRASPDHVVALENLGTAYRQAHRWEEARQALERALVLQPDNPEANYNLAMVFAQTDDTGRASDHLQRALRANPAYPEALNNLGILYLRTGRRDEAVGLFETCMRVAPAFAPAYVTLARVYRVEGAAEKEKSVLHALLKHHPEDAQAREELARLP